MPLELSMTDTTHQNPAGNAGRSLDEIGQTLADLAIHDALTADERGACEDALHHIELLERGEAATCAECGDEVLQTACRCGASVDPKACLEMGPEPQALLCTLPKGHKGNHWAQVIRGGLPVQIWPNDSDSEVTA